VKDIALLYLFILEKDKTKQNMGRKTSGKVCPVSPCFKKIERTLILQLSIR